MRHYPHDGVGFVPPLGEFLKVIPLSYVADASASISVCHLSVIEGKRALVRVEKVLYVARTGYCFATWAVKGTEAGCCAQGMEEWWADF